MTRPEVFPALAAPVCGHSGRVPGPMGEASGPVSAPTCLYVSSKWRKLPTASASEPGGFSSGVSFAGLRPGDNGPRPKFCPRSRFSFVGLSVNGGTQILAAGCNRNDCAYCGRKKAWAFIDRVRLLSAREKMAGWRVLFVTFNVRTGALTASASFPVVTRAVRQAVKQAQEPKKGQKRGGVAGRAWPGCIIRRVSSVDATAAGYAHRHDLFYVKARPGTRLPSNKALARRLWHYYARALSRLLGLQSGTGKKSLGFVHVQKSTGENAAAQYMGLHNGKVWHGEYKYPPRCRRLSSTPGFLPHLPKGEPGGFQFVKRSVYAAVCGLADAGIALTATGPASVTAAASPSSKAVLRHVFGYRTIATPRAGPFDPELRFAARYGLSLPEWHTFLENGAEGLARLCLPAASVAV